MSKEQGDHGIEKGGHGEGSARNAVGKAPGGHGTGWECDRMGRAWDRRGECGTGPQHPLHPLGHPQHPSLHPFTPRGTPAPTWRADGAASRTCCASLASVLTSRHCRSNSSRSPFPQQHSSAASRYWYRILNCESLRPSLSSLQGTRGSGQAWDVPRFGDTWGQARLRVSLGLGTHGVRPGSGCLSVWGHTGSGQAQGAPQRPQSPQTHQKK